MSPYWRLGGCTHNGLIHRNIFLYGWTASRNEAVKRLHGQKWEADRWNGRKRRDEKPPQMGDALIGERQRSSERRKRRNMELMSEEMMNGLKKRDRWTGSLCELCGRERVSERSQTWWWLRGRSQTDRHTVNYPEAGVIPLNRFHIKSKAYVMVWILAVKPLGSCYDDTNKSAI